VRANKVFSKLIERRGEGRVDAGEAPDLAGADVPDDLWELVLAAARRPEVVALAVSTLEFSLLAQHAHELAQLFHKLYHAHPVTQEEDDATRQMRRAVFTLFANEMSVILEDLLGIPIPEEM
jgi:arginyl-tRNA synthetase